MNYNLSWYTPDKVLYLKFSDKPLLADFKAANQAVLNALHSGRNSLFLIMDVNDLKPDVVSWENIRSSQTYMNDTNLEFVLIVGDNKNRLVRLMMLVVFNVSRVGLKFFQSLDEADKFVRHFSINAAS